MNSLLVGNSRSQGSSKSQSPVNEIVLRVDGLKIEIWILEFVWDLVFEDRAEGTLDESSRRPSGKFLIWAIFSPEIALI